MNKQGPGKIDWTDWTWNPISGCRHGCPYCYMRRMEKRFPGIMEPMFHTQRLKEPERKKPSRIFVGSSGDMWGECVPHIWINEVLKVCKRTPHTYQFLTKNPDRYGDFPPLDNAWYGTTVDGTVRTKDNIFNLTFWDNESGIKNRFISFEPLLMPVHPELFGIQWVIIGADSTRGASRPPKEWADIIIEKARFAGIPVWVKDNYGYPDVIKELPSSEQARLF
jgi:protein gp37